MHSMRLKHPTLGVCYYPEHWPEELWQDDFRRMKEHGIEIVRMAEFSWALLEPSEGVFEIGWFDRAMDLAHEYGLGVILGTPSATPPAWLTHKYPEVLNADMYGHPYHHGQRRQYNYNAAIYQQLSVRIASRMAEHYAGHPALLGWQIDNELNCECNVFYSDADHQAFREWLKGRYGTLGALNDAWGANFWSQVYTEWEQVHLCRNTVSQSPNPHQALDEKRFISDSAIRFCKLQSGAIRPTLKQGQFITTNGLFGHLDNHRMTDEALDFITYDSYPNFAYTLGPNIQGSASAGQDVYKDQRQLIPLAQVRAISSPFGIMEQQSGANGWVNRMAGTSPREGQMRLWALQSFAHGADMVSFFRWRSAPYGTEIYWHGLNDWDNRPNTRLAELKTIHKDFTALADWAGADYVAPVAVVCDYDNAWDGEFDQQVGPLMRQALNTIPMVAKDLHCPCDIVYLNDETKDEELRKYAMLFYPHPAILTEKRVEILRRYAANGGHLVMGARTGFKDIQGRCPMRPTPGPAATLCGVTVEAYTLQPAVSDAAIALGEQSLPATLCLEQLCEFEGGKAIARYQGGHYDGSPAMVRREVNDGTATYVGSGFTPEMVRALLLERKLNDPYGWDLSLPEEVELTVRRKGDKRLLMALHYGPEPIKVRVMRPMRDLFTGETLHGGMDLAPYGVLALVDI